MIISSISSTVRNASRIASVGLRILAMNVLRAIPNMMDHASNVHRQPLSMAHVRAAAPVTQAPSYHVPIAILWPTPIRSSSQADAFCHRGVLK